MDEKYDLTPSFLLQVPIHYAQKIEKGNPLDPLLLQILPLLEENKQNLVLPKTLFETFKCYPGARYSSKVQRKSFSDFHMCL